MSEELRSKVKTLLAGMPEKTRIAFISDRLDGKVVRISATELLKLRQSGGNNAASVAVCTCSEMESGWNR